MSARGSMFGTQARSVELLWKEADRPRRGPKPALSIERIVEAAIALADAHGLAAISMERIAESFGFSAMALYRYVPGKAELIDLMIDIGIGAPPPFEGAPEDWRGRLEAWTRALWEVFHRHPWSLEATNRLRVMGPNELGWLEAGLAALRQTALGPQDKHRACLALLAQVRNTAQFSVRRPGSEEGITGAQWAQATRALLAEREDRFPELTATLAAPTEPGRESHEDPLAFGIQSVLDGIEHRIELLQRERKPFPRVRGARARSGPGRGRR